MALLGLLLFSSVALASPSDDFMRSFQTPKMLFPSEGSDFVAVNPGRYPDWMMGLFQGLLLWKPTGQKGSYSEGCRPEDLSRALLENADTKNQAKVIEEHKSRCQKSFENNDGLGLLNTWKMMSMEFDVHHHSLIHPVVFKLAGGVKLKGLLALKGDLKKRPFVILRLGVFSNVEEFLPERFLLMQIFEQGLANVLVLENSTGADFIANNQRWTMGGYDEGLQNMQVVRMLRRSSAHLSQLISSVHLMGVSLGGHGVLFASLLNQYNGQPEHQAIQSFTTFCPVVRLQETLENLTASGIKGAGVDFWASQRLAGLKKKIPELAAYSFFEALKLKPVFLPTAVHYLVDLYPLRPSPLGNVSLPSEMEGLKSFWDLNNFWPYYRHIQSSVLVIATVHDHLVSAETNFFWLKQNSKSWDSDLGTVLFEKGYHCTLPVSYDWASVAAMVNARIMSKDQKTKLKMREISVDITDQLKDQTAQDLLSEFKNPNFELSWPNDHEVLVKFKGSDKKSFFTVILPVKELDFTFRDPLLGPEKTSVERWLNQNLQTQLKFVDGKMLAQIQWPGVL